MKKIENFSLDLWWLIAFVGVLAIASRGGFLFWIALGITVFNLAIATIITAIDALIRSDDRNLKTWVDLHERDRQRMLTAIAATDLRDVQHIGAIDHQEWQREMTGRADPACRFGSDSSWLKCEIAPSEICRCEHFEPKEDQV